MVYITVEAVTNIRNALKDKFPECKFSVRKEVGSETTVSVAILESPFFEDGESFHVNKIEGSKEQKKFLKQVEKVIKKAGEWYDHSDIKKGVFDVAFFYKIQIGREDEEKLHVKVEKEVDHA